MKTLYEGLLDSDLESQIDSNILDEFIKTNIKGNFKLTKDKKIGGFKMRGTMIIKNFTDREFPPDLMLTSVKGDVYIENCPNIESVGNLFGDLRYDDISLGRIEGTLSISDCKSFNSLRGVPSSVESIMLTDLPRLKSIEHLPKWATNVVIIKCGKKWTKEQIAKLSGFAKIMCSVEEYDNMINEAFSDPILLKLHKYLIDKKIEQKTIYKMLGGNVQLDNVRPSDAQHFKMPQDKTAARKALNLMQRDGYGFAVGFADDEPVFIANSDRRIYQIRSLRDGSLRLDGVSWRPTDFLNILTDSPYGPAGKTTDIYVYITNNLQTWPQRQDRAEAKRGAINVEDYKEIARQNRTRYKKAAAQMKAIKSNEEYTNLAKQVESCIERYAKTIVAVTKNPTDSAYWDFSSLSQDLSNLTKLFAQFITYLRYTASGTGNGLANIKSYKEACELKIKKLDAQLRLYRV